MILQDRPKREDYPTIKKSEAIRYMGGGSRTSISPEVDTLIMHCMEEISLVMEPRACYVRLPAAAAEPDTVCLGGIVIRSRALARHISGCSEAILFAATIGAMVDRRIRASELTSPARSLVLQAVGAAAIEAYCDDLNARLVAADRASGRRVCSRFSPGYGDFPLECQKSIFSFLQCAKQVGITLTDGMLMVPTKSVSAIIGIE